jgi:thermitase
MQARDRVRLLFLVLAFTPLATLVFPASAQVVPREILVGLREAPGKSPTALRAVDTVGAAAGYQPRLQVLRVRLKPGGTVVAAIERLQKQPGVLYAEPNNLVRALATPNDPYYGDQYAPQKVQANLAWDIWNPQAQAVIAIVDTGIDSSHPDLTNKIYRDASGIVGYNALTGVRSNAFDENGHGTHCAGVAAAEINNGVGIAGIAGWNPNVVNSNSYIKLMPVKALDADGSGSDASVADGIVWAADHGAKVISLSLGSSGSSTTLSNAVQYAWNRGCVIVAAAGNESTSLRSYPGAYTNVISVAATDTNDRLTSFSNYGTWVRVTAPGSQILSTTPTYDTGQGLFLDYDFLSGTSMATPHVAGEAALILSQAPSLTNSQVSTLITANVDAYTPYFGRTIATGAGRINIYKALLAAGAAAVTPTPVSLTFDWNPIRGGNIVTGRITLSDPAPVGGTIVTLATSNTEYATVPSSVTVPAGSSTATFAIATQPVNAVVNVDITATSGGRSTTARLQVWPAAPEELTLNPNPIRGGNLATATVVLNGRATTGGLVLSLSSSDTSLATVPATVTVPGGACSVTFTVTTLPTAVARQVNIFATANGQVRGHTLGVYPPAPEHIAFNPNPVRGGNTATATLILNGKAPAGGLVVSLSSENPSVAQVPATVTVPEGQSTATFPVTTSPVNSITLAVIRATTPEDVRRIALEVWPAAP